MVGTQRDRGRQAAYFAVIVGGLTIVAVSLLTVRPNAFTWIEAALGVFLAGYAGYLLIRSLRRPAMPDD
jgi:hypothetical protein